MGTLKLFCKGQGVEDNWNIEPGYDMGNWVSPLYTKNGAGSLESTRLREAPLIDARPGH